MNFYNLLFTKQHPGYNLSVVQNDIAILKLSTPVKFSNFIRPACLPKNQQASWPSEGSDVTIVGWVNYILYSK